MNYQEALDFIYSQLPIFQRVGKAAYKADLGNTLLLDGYFNYPHKKFKTIHIAGTNGKGSTSHMLAAVLQKAGYKTGLYTSPHLRDFRERIKINGEMIPKETVAQFITKHKPFFEKVKPSFFEMTVAMAFEYFAENNVDIAVIEVGLGGRLDSTNIINPLLSVITNISFDHTDLLGDTLQKIATEKAGIIKPNTPVIISKFQSEVADIFIQKANEMNAALYFADKEIEFVEQAIGKELQIFKFVRNNKEITIKTDILGLYQRYNIPGAIKAIEILKQYGFRINDDDIEQGLSNVQSITGLMGRWQKLSESPLIFCDTGHNEDGIRFVLKQISNYQFDKLHMVVGMVADKDIDKILSILPKDATYYFVQAQIPRALNHEELKIKAEAHNLKGLSYPTVSEGLEAAISNALPSDFIFVGGSTFVVAEVV
ncbi:bifunctional folylpolyglutamate synthase/dihydrofolate synthase [Tenuifilum thalassicum]|uniref:Dihydrofolate synthase/folylpolyglutamate synthase n=1 Tax=Tenuifilum thalassicum TaxID=2590900 RepID=A0A7D4BZ51_9BACT|nr:folylpolyglutamate synthase/dihydrofolate synthase family protein [Tenuifilum thalassicum]QKG79504.1 bifunctional folylpolyglutamate synthase/dihydrofolate synthase [Tenuifilum thalassicum]